MKSWTNPLVCEVCNHFEHDHITWEGFTTQRCEACFNKMKINYTKVGPSWHSYKMNALEYLEKQHEMF